MAKSETVRKLALLDHFQCLGDKCEDTCCYGWGMQLDPERKALYEKEAPELLDAVTTGESELIMRRDPTTDHCVKFSDGICSIHKEKGAGFLGDACHFFPRIVRQYGDQYTMSAALSCPEVTRLTLFGDEPIVLKDSEEDRLPFMIKDYLPDGITAEGTVSVIKAFVEKAGDESLSIEESLAHIINVAQSLECIDQARWPDAVPFYLKTAKDRKSEGIENIADPYRLLHALAGLMAATKQARHIRLKAVVEQIEKALKARIDWNTVEISSDDSELIAYRQLKKNWQDKAGKDADKLLHRWLQMEILNSGFPFSGFGRTVLERALLLGVRFATTRLALMAHMQVDHSLPPDATVVRIIQTVSRFLGHLQDPELSVNIYTEAGWMEERRMVGLLENA